MDTSQFILKKKLKQLAEMSGSGTELITVYLPPDANIHTLTSKLRDEYGQASNIKSKSTKKNVQRAIKRILEYLKLFKTVPKKGLAIFSGFAEGERDAVLLTIDPPMPIHVQTYRCDSQFWMEPLEQMITPSSVYGLFTVDKRESAVALLKGKSTQVLKVFTSMVPGKTRAGGQSSVRFERLRDIAAHEFYKKTGDFANNVFMSPEVTGIIVGGPGPTKNTFLNGKYFEPAVKNKIMGILDTGYTNADGINELVDKSGEILSEHEITLEKYLLNKFIKTVVKGGLATYGVAQVYQALEENKVDQLIICEDVDIQKIVFKCPSCGDSMEKIGVKSFSCPKCDLEMDAIEKTDVIEELVKESEDKGIEISIVSSQTKEGSQFLSLGGIGAFLRYK